MVQPRSMQTATQPVPASARVILRLKKGKQSGDVVGNGNGYGEGAPADNSCTSSTLAPLDPALVAFGDHLIAEVSKLQEPDARRHFAGKAFSPEYIALACAVQRLAAQCSPHVEQLFFALWAARNDCYAAANEDGVDDLEWQLLAGQPLIDAAARFIQHTGFLTPAPVPPDPPTTSVQAPAAGATVTVNNCMAAMLQADPSRAEWSAAQWARELEKTLGRTVSKAAVIKSRAWKKQISYVRASTQEEQIARERQRGGNPR
jgi:hypothetical protein